MIYSMTAFARVQMQNEEGNLVCELRSINHRYLDINLYLPDALRVLEAPIREVIRQVTKRGKIECSLRYQSNAATMNSLVVNETLVKEICAVNEKIASYIPGSAVVSTLDILRFPGVLEIKEVDSSVLEKAVMEIVEKATKELLVVRAREGEELKQLFLQRLDAMLKEIDKVRERLPIVIAEQHDRLHKKFAEIKLELDPHRLEQEIVIFAHRIDVTEELERIETHVAEFKRVLQQDSAVGRRLDFLLQELNREANTLGSKSVDSIVTHAAVELKVLIEQVREQVQNIE